MDKDICGHVEDSMLWATEMIIHWSQSSAQAFMASKVFIGDNFKANYSEVFVVQNFSAPKIIKLAMFQLQPRIEFLDTFTSTQQDATCLHNICSKSI